MSNRNKLLAYTALTAISMLFAAPAVKAAEPAHQGQHADHRASTQGQQSQHQPSHQGEGNQHQMSGQGEQPQHQSSRQGQDHQNQTSNQGSQSQHQPWRQGQEHQQQTSSPGQQPQHQTSSQGQQPNSGNVSMPAKNDGFIHNQNQHAAGRQQLSRGNIKTFVPSQLPGGALHIEDNPAYTTATYPDRSVVVFKDTGTVRTAFPTGNYIEVQPNGQETAYFPNGGLGTPGVARGAYTVQNPDGTQYSYGVDAKGNRIPMKLIPIDSHFSVTDPTGLGTATTGTGASTGTGAGTGTGTTTTNTGNTTTTTNTGTTTGTGTGTTTTGTNTGTGTGAATNTGTGSNTGTASGTTMPGTTTTTSTATNAGHSSSSFPFPGHTGGPVVIVEPSEHHREGAEHRRDQGPSYDSSSFYDYGRGHSVNTGSSAAASIAAAPTPRPCLSKEYLANGPVLFKDTCTNEWATGEASQSGTRSSNSACLHKDYPQAGQVRFTDSCLNEVALNPPNPGQAQN